jgi:hypothetical protein
MSQRNGMHGRAFVSLTACSCPRRMLKGLWLDFPRLLGATNDKISSVGYHLADRTSDVGSAEAANGLGKRLTSTSA